MDNPLLIVSTKAIWVTCYPSAFFGLWCGSIPRLSIFNAVLYGPRREKTCIRVFENKTGAHQPAHPRSLISVFVIRFLGSIICKLVTGEISIFKLVTVAEMTGLKFAWPETPKTGFVATRPICYSNKTGFHSGNMYGLKRIFERIFYSVKIKSKIPNSLRQGLGQD